MNINIEGNKLLTNSSLGASNKLTETLANQHVQIKTSVPDEQNNLQEVKTLLKNNLQKYSAQALNSLYQSAQDGRLQAYSDNQEKQVYQTFIDRVTQHINTGSAQGEASEKLNSLLQSISQGAEQAHTETQKILSALGKLDAHSDSYIAQSSTYTRLALSEIEANISPTESHERIDDNKKAFSLQVTTREGDTIDIKIKQAESKGGTTFASTVSVSYEVEGDLSESEKVALSELMNAIGSSSDSLLAGNDLTQLMGIDNFNGQQLSGFSLALNGNQQTINYRYQHSDNQQHLTGNWSQKGQIKAQFNLQSQLGGDADSEQLARYLDLIEQAATSSYKHNDDKDQSDQTSLLFANTFTDFMQLADKLGESLKSVDKQFSQARAIAQQLFEKNIQHPNNRLGLKDEQHAKLKEGFNQLADFSASFVANKGGHEKQGINRDIKSLTTGYEIALSQKTSIEHSLIDANGVTGVKQSQSVKFDSLMNASLNTRSHQFSEKYQIMAAFDEDKQLKGYQQSRNVSEQSKENIYQLLGEYRFTEKDKNSLTENKRYLLQEGISESSKMDGFENSNKGFKAGDIILSQMQFSNNLHYQSSQFTASEASFQRNQQTQISIASQKMLLDVLFDKL